MGLTKHHNLKSEKNSVVLGCGQSAAQNCTYVENSGAGAGSCKTTICKCNSNICQVFVHFYFDVISCQYRLQMQLKHLSGLPWSCFHWLSFIFVWLRKIEHNLIKNDFLKYKLKSQSFNILVLVVLPSVRTNHRISKCHPISQ